MSDYEKTFGKSVTEEQEVAKSKSIEESVAEISGKIELSDDFTKLLINQTLQMSMEIYDILQQQYDTLVDIANGETDKSVLGDNFLDNLKTSLETIQRRLDNDVFSNSPIQYYFDTTSVCAFVGEAVGSINKYRLINNKKLLAESTLKAIYKSMEYIQMVASCLKYMDKLDLDGQDFQDNPDLAEAIEVLLDPDTIDLVEQTDVYGKTYLVYNGLSVRDDSSLDDDDDDDDDDESHDRAVSFNAVDFDLDNLRN